VVEHLLEDLELLALGIIVEWHVVFLTHLDDVLGNPIGTAPFTI
jgi:hypothetical protein